MGRVYINSNERVDVIMRKSMRNKNLWGFAPDVRDLVQGAAVKYAQVNVKNVDRLSLESRCKLNSVENQDARS